MHRLNPALFARTTPNRISGLSGWWKQGDCTSASERASQWNDSSGNARHLLQGTGANQPIALAWYGTNYGWAPGTASNGFTASTKTITGNVTLTIDCALDSLTAGTVGLLGKLTGNNGIRLDLNNTSNLVLRVGDGAAATPYSSTAAVTSLGVADFQRVTYSAVYVDGAAGNVQFYVNGQQLGNTVNTTKTLVDGNTPFQIAGAVTAQKTYSASITNGASTTYYSVDFTQVAEGTTNFTQNGDTYTVNASGAKQAQIIGSSQLIGDGAAYFMRASYTQAQPVTRFILARRNLWSITGAARYTMDGVGANSAAILDSTATPKTSINAGSSVAENTGMSLSTYHAVAAVFSGAGSSYQIDANSATTGNAGATTTGGLTIFADGGTPTASTFSGTQAKEIIEYNRALSQGEINQVMRYLSRIGNLGLAL